MANLHVVLLDATLFEDVVDLLYLFDLVRRYICDDRPQARVVDTFVSTVHHVTFVFGIVGGVEDRGALRKQHFALLDLLAQLQVALIAL